MIVCLIIIINIKIIGNVAIVTILFIKLTLTIGKINIVIIILIRS
jgi:hypothetical protein